MSPDPDIDVDAPVQAIAGRVRDLRRRRGMSAERLAEEMTSVGVRWDRFVVTNLERGRRQNITVTELLALAYVLDVAPVNLLVPLESDRWYAYVPEHAAPSGRVRAWVRGRYWMPRPANRTGERDYFTDVPDEEWEPPASLTEEQRDQQRKERLALLQALEDAGQLVRHEDPGGATRWTPPDAS